MTPEEYMGKPYTYCLVYDSESDTWTGTLKEFPGCIAQADTGAECLWQLDRAAIAWIEAALDIGQEIPEPEGK